MDRSEAATALLLWQVEGDSYLPDTGDGGTLVSWVESMAATTAPRPHPKRPRPLSDFLRLDEERDLDELRSRLRVLASCLGSEEREKFEHRLEMGPLPEGRIASLRGEIERLEARHLKRELTRDFEARVAPRTVLQSVLLFARDGRLLAREGEASSVDPVALAGLISRGETGSTWSLTQATVTLVGHLGTRSALVAVFAGRPRADAGATLRVSVGSLEERDRLTNALGHPGGHEALRAFVRTVRVLMEKNA
ncbi:MAG: hypothetical protein AABY30_03890 [Candidatus Thermoplasmatota archaeon]